jgi:cytochrome d ubiquinol oxidase subunit I
MTDLLAARSQMALSLAFHIVFAAIGIGMPFLMVAAEAAWRKTGNDVYLDLAKRWQKGVAILFATGAVSGTALSFELGLLWPGFMAFAGPIIGMPFSMEGFAFFLEAIFLGVYLYGWDRVPGWLHLASGVLVGVSGVLSGVFVLAANAWMNAPTGFSMVDGVVVGVDPVAAMFNSAMFPTGLHMTVAAFEAVGLGVAAIHALALLRAPGSPFHRAAIRIALPIGAAAALFQPFTGHIVGEHVAEHQPVKLAAMEALFETTSAAPMTIGGWPDEATATTSYAIEIPYLLSLLSFGDVDATVQGLNDFPREDWPPVAVTHVAHQVMIGLGTYMAAVSALWLAVWAWRRRLPEDRRLLWLLASTGPMGFVCIEAGWTVTEVGRQPWIIQGVMRTADAVTPMPHLTVPFLAFTALYIGLGVVVTGLMWRQVLATVPPRGEG